MRLGLRCQGIPRSDWLGVPGAAGDLLKRVGTGKVVLPQGSRVLFRSFLLSSPGRPDGPVDGLPFFLHESGLLL